MASRHKYDVGYTNINPQGLKYTVIVYRNHKDVDIQFEDGFIIEHIPVTRLNQNILYHPNHPKPKRNRTPINKRLGETGYNNQGRKMTIIAYRNSIDIDVQFENEFVVEIAPGVKITVVKHGVAEVETEEVKAEEKK